MHGSMGGSWKRNTLDRVTAVGQPNGKPPAQRLPDLHPDLCHRANARPYSMASGVGVLIFVRVV
jgi:hypothetical protein